GDDEPGGADAALERRLLEKRLLDRVQPRGCRDALDRQDLLALGLDAEHQARVHEPAVDENAAGAAVAIVAALFRPSQPDVVPEHFEHALTGRARPTNGRRRWRCPSRSAG